jgi:hypothetical protein
MPSARQQPVVLLARHKKVAWQLLVLPQQPSQHWHEVLAINAWSSVVQ